MALAGLMVSQKTRDRWLVRMAPEMFVNPAEQEMFRCIRAVHQKGKTPDPENCFDHLCSVIGKKRGVSWYLNAFKTFVGKGNVKANFYADTAEDDIPNKAGKYILELGNRWANRIAGMGEAELAAMKVCGFGPDQVIAREVQLAKNEANARDVTTPTAEAIEALDDGDTDLAAANRLVKAHGHNIRYCPANSTWYVWDHKHWRFDDGAKIVHRLAAQTARQYTISRLGGDMNDLRNAKKLENDSRLRGAVRTAESIESVTIGPNQFDAIPYLLNFQNGTVDLRTAELGPHVREHFNTHLLDVEYAPKTGCPRFLRFLEEIHPGQPEVTEFLRRWVGYCLTGETREHKFIVAVGEGRNGKSVLFETLSALMGPQLSGQAPRSLLMHRKYDGHPAEFQSLKGKRLVLISEIDGGQSFGAERVKWLTGGDSITARGMRENFSTFMPTHKFCMYLNELPEVTDSSTAFWERVRVIHFNEQFIGKRQDPTLKQTMLEKEAAGIIAWAVSGAKDWYDSGLTNPTEVDLASLAYRNDSDDVKKWLEDILLDGTMDSEQSAKFLSDSYSSWAERNGGRSLTMKALSNELKRHKATRKHTKRGTVWSIPSLEQLLGTVTGDTCDTFSDSSLMGGVHGDSTGNTCHHLSPVTADDEDCLPF